MKKKVSELEGAKLDFFVAKIERFHRGEFDARLYSPPYSTDWRNGGPIIERERLTIEPESEPYRDGRDIWAADVYPGGMTMCGGTPLLAAMRCFVVSKFGEEVEIP